MREQAKSLKQEIEQSPRESADTSGGMTLQQVAVAIGLNYNRLVATKNKMSVETFLEYLHRKSGVAWRYDATAARYGKYFQRGS